MLDPAGPVQGNDEEAPTAADLDDDRQELWVDGAKVGVEGVPGDLDIVITLVPLHGGAVHVTELGTAGKILITHCSTTS